jgi:hypothetical protein
MSSAMNIGVRLRKAYRGNWGRKLGKLKDDTGCNRVSPDRINKIAIIFEDTREGNG